VRGIAESQIALGGRSRVRLGRVIWLAGQVFSFETTLLLFTFAPIYKTDPRFAWFPGDMSVAFFGLSVLAGLVPLLRGSLFFLPGIRAVYAAGMLVLWMAASLAWSPSHIYANEKLVETAAGNLWCLIATAMIMSSSRVRVWRFLILLLAFGVVTSLDYTINSITAPAGARVDYYLVLGRLCGLAALVAFALWLRSPPRSAQGPLLLAAFAVCGYVLLKGGGRNPAVAVAVPMLMSLLMTFGLLRGGLVIRRSILPSLGLVVVLTAVLSYLAISDTDSLRTLQRFDHLVGRLEAGESANPRVELWGHAVAYWAERPLVGHGVGAWPILLYNRDERHYPHNLILELLVELGLVGLVLFAALVIVLARRVSLRRLREDPALMCAAMLCVNAFINAMSTGDISDNRTVFAMLGLLAMRPPGGPMDADSKGRPTQLGARGLRPLDAPQSAHVGDGQAPSRGRRATRGH
jgi:O-antigen ligase